MDTKAAIVEAMNNGTAFSWKRDRKVQEGAWGNYSQAHWQRFMNI